MSLQSSPFNVYDYYILHLLENEPDSDSLRIFVAEAEYEECA